MTEMEALLDQLRASPLENTGLVEALKKQCDALRFRTGADVRFSVGELPPSESLPRERSRRYSGWRRRRSPTLGATRARPTSR